MYAPHKGALLEQLEEHYQGAKMTWDHQRQGCPAPPFSRAEPRSHGPLFAQEHAVAFKK